MNDITLVCIDTCTHELAKKAIEKSLENIDPKEVVIFSDKNFFTDGQWIKINPLNRKEYSEYCIKQIYKHINTDFVLIVQNDGMATNKEFWSDDFLNYDYIGAPWPENIFISFSGVGNGGFSLRSKKLLYELQNDKVVYDGISNKIDCWDTSGEDYVICVEYRKYLETRGIKFASLEIANQFSHEFEPEKKNTFGFHGKFNVPHYLNDIETEHFIKLLSVRFDKTYMIMLLELIRLEKYNLAKLATDLGRYNNVWNIFFPKYISYIDVLKEVCIRNNFFHSFVYDIIKKIKSEYADTE